MSHNLNTVTRTPAGQRRRPFTCCTPTGRFCFNSCAWLDPCCEGKESPFVLYGAGATSYFKGIKVLMHSSLSGTSNQQLGRSVGVDEYVSKFEPQRLAQTLARLLS